MALSEETLAMLKTCNKMIIRLEPRKQKSQDNQKRQTILIISEDGGHQFEIFTRQNTDILINFTAWLIYKAPDNMTHILCRYNGDHWEHRNKMSGEIIRGFHKHLYKTEYVENGLADDWYAEFTDVYDTLTEAIQKVCIDYNINNFEQYFPIDRQVSLF
jgi:hypothetical protein